MKRFVSVVMTLVMLLSMFITASSATINEIASALPQEFNRILAVSVLAREAGIGDYATSLKIDGAEVLGGGVIVDYKATLDMQPIRDFVDNIVTLIGNDSDAKEEFNKAKIETEISVTVEYPETAEIINDEAGDLESYNTIFSEKKEREILENKVIFTYKNKDGLTAKELKENKNTYLKDLTFLLENNVKYTKDGYHTVKVSLAGWTKVNFDTRVQTVKYSGGGAQIVSAATNHVLEVVPVVPATCDENGWTEGVRCKIHAHLDDGYGCGAHGIVVPQHTIPKLNHDTVLVPLVDSTCTEKGIKEHYMCLNCKKDFKDAAATQPMTKSELEIPLKDHVHYDIPAIPATCTTNGLSAGQGCTECDHVHDRTIIHALGHDEETTPAVPATCTTDGWTEQKKCLRCGVVTVPKKPIAATGHKFGEWTVTVQPTEETPGKKTKECLNNCGTKVEVEIPKLVHECKVDEKATVVEKAPTCTETGLQQKYCACGKKVGEPEVINAIGHSVTKIEKREASCSEEGILEHYACKNCGGLFTDAECKNKITSARIPVDLTKHPADKKEALPAVAPTCEKEGLKAGEKCSACKVVTKKQELLPKKHDLLGKEGDPFEDVSEKAPTCTEKGMHAHKHCTICDKNYVLDENNALIEIFENDDVHDYVLPALGHSFKYVNMEVTKEPTETEKGIAKVYCERYEECKHYKTVDIAVLEHTHNEECEKIIKPATCTEYGLKIIVYTCCNEVKPGEIKIPAKHDPRKIEKVDPTCYEKGVKEHWYCKVCDQIFSNENCTEASKTTIEKLYISELTHVFEFHHENDNFVFNKCERCNDMQKIAKLKDKETEKEKAKVVDNGNDKEKPDKVKEDRYNEEKSEDTGRKSLVYSETNLKETELSTELEKEILARAVEDETKKAGEEKVVVDITVEIVTIYVAEEDKDKEIYELEQREILDEERERVVETNNLKKIDIFIPETMRDFVDYQVYRLHEGVADYLTTNENEDGEYIVIAADKTKVTICVNKFSEYALVGYETKVNPDPIPTPSYGGGASISTHGTIKFNTNGGTIAESIRVKFGEVITPPEVTRDGYILEGWYTDYALTKPFDFTQPIKSNVTLYAKWVALHECRGIHEDNCPCLKFVDLDPTLWYHRGVDYVLNNKMMIGVDKTVFAPDWDVTRAMLVTVLWRAEGMPTGEATTFADLEEGLYYVPAVEWAAKNGVVKGYSDVAFGPNDPITREQFATIMYRYARNKGFDISAKENANIASYADYSTVSEYAIESMKYAVGSGLIKGRTETTLNPKEKTTRAEMATMIYRFYTQLAK